MVFLTIFATLAVAMISLSTLNAKSAGNLGDVERARGVAEAGLRWQAYRFKTMARPKTLSGTVDQTVANALWPAIKTAIQSDYSAMAASSERAGFVDNGTSLVCPTIALDSARTRLFNVTIAQDPLDARNLIVTSTGRYGNVTRKMSMVFTIDKKVKFAVVGKVPIQIGRNTLIEGNIAMAVPAKYPPILMLNDLDHFDSAMKAKMDAWEAFLKASTTVNGVAVKNHKGYDNRISVNNPVEYQIATAKGYTDVNTDGYIDEYDLLLKQYDSNHDNTLTKAEFTNPSTGQSYESVLFSAIDALGGPLYAGDVTRLGYKDNVISNADAYAKVRGTLTIATTEAAWASNLASSGSTINDMIGGSIAVANPTDVPVKFGATSADLFDLDPSNFDQCCANFKAKSGSAAGATVRNSSAISNTTLTASDANGSKVVEQTPYGSTSWQATYQRPVFKNLKLTNVIIPKGLNPLFDNCTFEGVTFVDTERNITNSSGTVSTSKDDGSSWAGRKVAGDNFSNTKVLLGAGGTPVSGQSTTLGSTQGNNIRFNDCTFHGPLAGDYATAYTHYANSWEFTGKTLFDNQVDQTATIVSPQVNIEMGSFSDPNTAPSTLVGVVVAGNLDVRGYSSVDGSILITGDGAGNTTLGYFGTSDSDTSLTAMPEGGYGKLNIRYNPNRALPDGINIAVDILPNSATYTELTK